MQPLTRSGWMEWFADQPVRCVNFGPSTDHWHLEHIDIDPFEDLIEVRLEASGRRRRLLLDGTLHILVPLNDRVAWTLEIVTRTRTVRFTETSRCAEKSTGERTPAASGHR